jgi:DNA-binding NarL/FixJ family response regulator
MRAGTIDLRHRYPWRVEEEVAICRAKRAGEPHKVIARELQRTPRAVDQHVARMKDRGLLAMHEAEEAALLERLEAEAALPDAGEWS